ncbi:hypothetical protein [Dermabacter jinjuensis]|uniref:DUF4352 domain-containing protein n=1 Tax=Dermabacter jinjuensis TaxID=1667168 RepID=A0ABM6PNX5_9MICO|nr:hypothetical protein [Dermabacter jinjuensis]ATH97064.1 hypothetical protein COP05_08165 [Dermabacter jinjuensis]UEB89222.1 hypothetical protein LK448_06860 [Dermabacter jinjuensis]
MTTTTMTKRRLAAALAAASLLVAGASGCSFGVLGSSDEKPTEQASAAAPADNSNGGDQGSGAGGANPAPGASDAGGAPQAGSDQGGENGKPASGGQNKANYPAPVFTTERPVEVKEDPNATLTVNLHQLKREGETVTAYVSFTLNSTAKEAKDFFFLNGSLIWKPFLIDNVNLKKHTPLSTTNSQHYAMTPMEDVDLMPGQTTYAFATFAAPPADVKQMDVSLMDGTEVAKGVEIK